MLVLLPFFAFNYLFSALYKGITALFSVNQNQVIFSCILFMSKKPINKAGQEESPAQMPRANIFGHAHGVGVQSRYKLCNAKKHVGV